jgi:hypothetical protein
MFGLLLATSFHITTVPGKAIELTLFPISSSAKSAGLGPLWRLAARNRKCC